MEDKNKMEDRLKLSDEFSVTVNKINKATEVNAPVPLKRKKKEIEKVFVIGAMEPNEEIIAHEPQEKIVYAYDKDFIFLAPTICFECRIEKGVFHIPPNCTDIEPDKTFVFQKFDPKKQIWIEYFPPVTEPEKEPELTKEQKEAKIRMERNTLLGGSDYTQLADGCDPLKLVDWQAYRKALRDITAQPGFPDTVIWPTKPV